MRYLILIIHLGSICCLLAVNTVFAQTNNVVAPFAKLLKSPVNLRPELKGKHPRLFFTAEDLPGLRQKSKTSGKDLWQIVLANVRAIKREPPRAGDPMLDRSGVEQKPGDVSQYAVAFTIAEATMVYAIEQDEKYLEAAQKWLFEACKYEPWGYTFRTPNVDLPPAHLLYAVAFAYDVLYDKLTADERAFVREKLIKQARLMYDYFKYKEKKRYAYSQNHTSIPMAGLAMAAYVLFDETEEAKEWAKLARAIFDRVLTTFGTDGYFYEGFHYYTFSFRWTIRYLDAHKQATGEDLYPQVKDKFQPLKYYVAHSILPDGKTVFDFADTGDGSENRVQGEKTETLYGDWELLYRLASVYQDEQAQGVAEFVRQTNNFPNRENIWAFLNYNSNIKPASINTLPTSHYFADGDTAFWRSDWTKNATAFAFRCAPPEGHHAAKLIAQIPDWRQSTGHAHPDANSFIIWANGKYLTGDTGYSGKKMTEDHNTILVNGRGQEKDGRHEMFKEVAPERLDKIRIAETASAPDYFYARGEAAAGYYTDLSLRKFDRHFLYVAPDYFVIWDELETVSPSEFTFLLNADRETRVINQTTAEILNETAGLRVIRLSPQNANSRVVPQMVQARGRPGSVEKGTEEQRGVQLQSATGEKHAKLDFVHFLQPFLLAEKPDAPRIEKTEKGLKVIWKSGAEDLISLESDNRFIERRAKNGKKKRIEINVTKK